MRKQLWLNGLLLLLAIGLGIGVWQTEAPDNRLERLSATPLSAISQIRIRHGGKLTALEKTPRGWSMTAPVRVEANAQRLQSVLALLHAPVHARYPLGEVSLDELGLKKPQTSVDFDDVNIAFGKTNPLKGLRYIRRGDEVLLIEDVYSPLLEAGFSALVSLALLPQDARIDKLELVNQTLTRRDDGGWQSTQPLSPDRRNAIVDDWQRAQAFGVHRMMPREPLGKVRVFLHGQESPIVFQITDTDPWLVLAREDLQIEYHLDIENYDRLISPTPAPAPTTNAQKKAAGTGQDTH